MNTNNCPSCSKQIPEASSFCPFCAVPVKCKACGESWLKDAVACYQCGTKLEVAGSAIAANSIHFEQAGKNRKLTASFSDNVGVHLSGVLQGLVSGQSVEYRPFSPVSQQNGPQRKAISFKSTRDRIPEAVIENEVNSGNHLETLGSIFKEEGDHLILHDHRLKQTSQLDFAKRLTMLFLYAQQQRGQQLTSRDALNAILTQEKLNDGNTRHWLANASELQLRDDGQVELRPAGIDKAKNFLAEIANPAIEQKNISISVGKSKKKASPKEGTESGSSKGSSSGPGPWKAISLLVGEGYFKTPKTIAVLHQHCGDQRAWRFAQKDLSSSLTRMVKDGKLKRNKNAAGQFEYYAS